MSTEYRVVYRRPNGAQTVACQNSKLEAQWFIASLWREPIKGVPFQERPVFARIESREVSEWQTVEVEYGK